MKTFSPICDVHPVVYAVKSLVSKLRQHPEIYPIKHFKKGRKTDKIKKHQLN